jgi:hypothetical protein
MQNLWKSFLQSGMEQLCKKDGSEQTQQVFSFSFIFLLFCCREFKDLRLGMSDKFRHGLLSVSRSSVALFAQSEVFVLEELFETDIYLFIRS